VGGRSPFSFPSLPFSLSLRSPSPFPFLPSPLLTGLLPLPSLGFSPPLLSLGFSPPLLLEVGPLNPTRGSGEHAQCYCPSLRDGK